MLQDLCGQPLVVRTFQNIQPLTGYGATVVVATDSSEIYERCIENDVPCLMTRECGSGTERCNLVSRHYPEKEYILNVQGDEPFVDIMDLLRMMHGMQRFGNKMGTLIFSSTDMEDGQDPNVVKVVRDIDGNALYFSRALIPCATQRFWRHIGVYGYHRVVLRDLCVIDPTSLERAERLEQLRAVQAGIKIKTFEARHQSLGVDTEEDLKHAKIFFRKTRQK
jgi:3-deoxy-manno-octulosonate cytidylyltransferase (CMP-KDO synthetase)